MSPILKALSFQGEPGARKLLDAIEHFKEKDPAVDIAAPGAFLDSEEQAKVTQDGRFRVSLYKALLFLHVQSGIKSGPLNLEHSYKYRPLDDYLIDRARWQRDKQQVIERAGLDTFVDPQKVLKELDEALYQQYLITNQDIAEGKNPHIKFGKNGDFALATPKQEESDAEPLQHFFPERRFVPLVEILATVNAPRFKSEIPGVAYVLVPMIVEPRKGANLPATPSANAATGTKEGRQAMNRR